ncbi:tape measure domain-containing protein [Streptococcus cuniculi]|uniref:Tape measure domain-containing protein n=2 Tax=Streptococcus cuniculi TaxID=1432788 RepID=A0A4Y9JAD6_9STRE|nr:tape measure protein [Streptococcus cuniculi]TFU97993.1 tape measure domain-containing protein [Streptococcus cuniculi]
MQEKAEMLGKSLDKSSFSFKNFALGGAAFKVAQAGLDLLSSSLDGAIKRFDTLEKFPVVMKSMGHSVADVTASTDKLANGIDGLPTTLDEVVSTTQRLTSLTGDLRKSTDLTLSLNNAFLASGSSSADASRGLQQFSQMLSSGKVDMQSWRTLQETMPYALQKTAESFGFAGKSAQNDFYGALKTGNITFDQFSNKLIELNGGVGGFAELAKKNSKGIGTSFSNLKNAVVKGVANIIKSFDEWAKAATGKSIAENLDSLKGIINITFKILNGAIKASTPLFKVFFSLIQGGISVLRFFTPLIAAMTAAFIAQKVVASITGIIQGYSVAVQVMNAAIALSTSGQMANAAAFLYQQGVLKAGAVLYGLLTGQLSLITAGQIAASAATGLWTAAVGALKAAWLANPFGLVVAGIAAVTVGAIALWKWLSRDSEETKRLKEEQDELKKSTDDLVDSVETHARTRKEELESVQSNTESYAKLAQEIQTLSSKENKSAADKKNLQKKVDVLNESVEGLNLVYDKNTDSLSHNNQQIQARIDALEAESKWNQSQKNLLEIEKERNDVSQQLVKIAQLKKEWADNTTISYEQQRVKIRELTKEEDALKEKQTELQTEYDATSKAQQAAAEAMAVAAENGADRQVVAYESMSDAQRTAIDNMRSKYNDLLETTTNMFDQIEMKSAISVDQMIANLQKNQEAMNAWADNLNVLASRGVDEGILAKLKEMGPQGGLYVQELVNASQEKLYELNTQFRAGGDSAVKGLTAGMDEGALGLTDTIKGLVQNQTNSLKAEIESADFASLGKEIPNGVTKGIDEGAKTASDSSQKLSEDIRNRFKEDMGINSPSRIFTEFGDFITQGLSKGITTGSIGVVAQMGVLASQVQIPFISLPIAFTSIGVMAMSGFASGIYAGSGSVIAAAQSVANRVKSTIQKALEIHSPSRVMRDEVGRFIPQGIAVGIEADSDVVMKSMEKLRQASAIQFTPEVALGVDKSLASQVTMKNTVSHRISEKIELMTDKAGQMVERALEVAEEAVKRPVSLSVSDREIARTTGDAFAEYHDRQVLIQNRMRGAT